MFPGQKSDAWRPTAQADFLKQRAQLIATIRQFFLDRQVLEVETPLLSHAAVTDPYVLSIPATFTPLGAEVNTAVFLQTSPEYAMKRLLAAGLGPIYQICKAFRQGDLGRLHNPEFTMLEWYRPGFNHHDLMDEMDEFLQYILHTAPAERLTYAALFEKFLRINPHAATQQQLIDCAKQQQIQIELNGGIPERNFWLNLLMTHCIEPQIGLEKPLFLYDFPVSQAALAKIRADETPPVASRFEVHFKGLELANGFHELQNPQEQRQRFLNDLAFRSQQGMPSVAMDELFLASLAAGLPDCAGVALGVDRLVMIALNAHSIAEVLSFSFERA